MKKNKSPYDKSNDKRIIYPKGYEQGGPVSLYQNQLMRPQQQQVDWQGNIMGGMSQGAQLGGTAGMFAGPQTAAILTAAGTVAGIGAGIGKSIRQKNVNEDAFSLQNSNYKNDLYRAQNQVPQAGDGMRVSFSDSMRPYDSVRESVRVAPPSINPIAPSGSITSDFSTAMQMLANQRAMGIAPPQPPIVNPGHRPNSGHARALVNEDGGKLPNVNHNELGISFENPDVNNVAAKVSEWYGQTGFINPSAGNHQNVTTQPAGAVIVPAKNVPAVKKAAAAAGVNVNKNVPMNNGNVPVKAQGSSGSGPKEIVVAPQDVPKIEAVTGQDMQKQFAPDSQYARDGHFQAKTIPFQTSTMFAIPGSTEAPQRQDVDPRNLNHIQQEIVDQLMHNRHQTGQKQYQPMPHGKENIMLSGGQKNVPYQTSTGASIPGTESGHELPEQISIHNSYRAGIPSVQSNYVAGNNDLKHMQDSVVKVLMGKPEEATGLSPAEIKHIQNYIAGHQVPHFGTGGNVGNLGGDPTKWPQSFNGSNNLVEPGTSLWQSSSSSSPQQAPWSQPPFTNQQATALNAVNPNLNIPVPNQGNGMVGPSRKDNPWDPSNIEKQLKVAQAMGNIFGHGTTTNPQSSVQNPNDVYLAKAEKLNNITSGVNAGISLYSLIRDSSLKFENVPKPTQLEAPKTYTDFEGMKMEGQRGIDRQVNSVLRGAKETNTVDNIAAPTMAQSMESNARMNTDIYGKQQDEKNRNAVGEVDTSNKNKMAMDDWALKNYGAHQDFANNKAASINSDVNSLQNQGMAYANTSLKLASLKGGNQIGDILKKYQEATTPEEIEKWGNMLKFMTYGQQQTQKTTV
jgi:hypothetical protein